MAFRALSRMVTNPAKSGLFTYTGIELLGLDIVPYRAPCAGVRTLSIFGGADQNQTSGDNNSGSQLQTQKQTRGSPVSRRSSGLRRAPRGDLANSYLDVWDPVFGDRTLKQMLNAVDRLFADPFITPTPDPTALGFRTPWDVTEDESAFKIRIDMPGLTKEEVKVSIEDCDLVIKGEHKVEGQEEDALSARGYGIYNARLTLPENAKIDEVKAEIKNGVLHVIVPKSKEEPKKSVIDINVE